MRKARLTEDERLKKGVREWFEQQPDKERYLKELILNDKRKNLRGE